MVTLLHLILSLFLLATPAFGGGEPQAYRVKANYLLNLPLFVEFPGDARAGQVCPDFTICLMGDTPLAKVLEPFKGRQVKRRPLAIRSVTEMEETDCCQLLFIASSERYRVQPLLSEASRRGILTVSDMRDFVRLGGMIGLVSVNNRITFSLNRDSAHRASISFDTQLLRLADDIIR